MAFVIGAVLGGMIGIAVTNGEHGAGVIGEMVRDFCFGSGEITREKVGIDFPRPKSPLNKICNI